MGSPSLIVLACAFVALLLPGSLSQELPEHILQELTLSGSHTLEAEVKKLQHSFEVALNAFKPVNHSCSSVLEAQTGKCKTCVMNLCQHRAEHVCKQSTVHQVVNAATQGLVQALPDIIEASLKDVSIQDMTKAVVKVGTHIKDIAVTSINKIKPVATAIGSHVIDVGKVVGSNLVNVGKVLEKQAIGAGKELLSLGSKIQSGAVTAGEGLLKVGSQIESGLVNLGGKLGSTVLNLGSKLGGLFGSAGKGILSGITHLFGRRALLTRAAEPGCDAIQHHDGCKHYISSCAACTMDPAKQCPGYDKALQRLQEANTAHAFLLQVKEWNYQVLKVVVDGKSYDPTNYGYTGVEVTVNILGKALKFPVTKPVNPYNPGTAAAEIAKEAMQYLKLV